MFNKCLLLFGVTLACDTADLQGIMSEVGKQANVGNFNGPIISIGRLVANVQMGSMIKSLADMAANGRFNSTIDAALALVASGTLNATIEPVITAALRVDINALLNMSRLSGVTESMQGLEGDLAALGNAFKPVYQPLANLTKAAEFEGVERSVNAIGQLTRKYQTLADLNQTEVLTAIKNLVVVGGKLAALPSIRKAATDAGQVLASGKLNKIVVAFGAVFTEHITPAMSTNISDMVKPVVDAAIKAVGTVIDSNQLDGLIKAMGAMATTVEVAAMKPAMQAIGKEPAFAKLKAAVMNMRDSKDMVNTKDLADDAAGAWVMAAHAHANL